MFKGYIKFKITMIIISVIVLIGVVGATLIFGI
jgi:hypothetical protein